MVGAEAALEIRILHRHGKGVRAIAREIGLSRNTVRRYLRDEAAMRYRPRPPRATKLDPFKDYLVRRVAAAAPARLPATVLIGELRERGYAGGITMLKVFLAALQPVSPAAPVQRFETAPGQQMQVDWAVIQARTGQTSIGVDTRATQPSALPQEGAEFEAPMPQLSAPEHDSGFHVEGGKQVERAIPTIIVPHVLSLT